MGSTVPRLSRLGSFCRHVRHTIFRCDTSIETAAAEEARVEEEVEEGSPVSDSR